MSANGIAEQLRAEWRMIAAVSLRQCRDGDGFEADLRLDPIVVKGSLEQQGYPRTADALAKIDARRQAALADCVSRVNERLSAARRIKAFTVTG
jgi:hypothetical protein